MSVAFRPMKPRASGSTKDVVTRLVDESGGLKEAAFRLERGVSVVAAYTDPDHPQHINYDQVRRLTGPESTAAAEDLASLAGGVFLPLVGVECTFQQAIAASAIEQGELVAAVIQAQQDGRICALDRSVVSKAIEQVMRELARAHATLKQRAE
jgi:hypothetical protein